MNPIYVVGFLLVFCLVVWLVSRATNNNPDWKIQRERTVGPPEKGG